MFSARSFLLLPVVYLLLAFSGNAQSLHGVSRGVLWTGQVVDLATTEVFLRRGYQEGNPFLRNRAARIAITTGSTILVDKITTRLRNEHPRVALIMNFATGGARIAVGLKLNLRR